MRITADVLAKYKAQSQRPDNMGYSPLQCAAYEGDKEDIDTLLNYYKSCGEDTLIQELCFTSTGIVREHLLHIAMKYPDIFQACCKAIEHSDPSLFQKLIFEQDNDGDTLFHKMAEFGRKESFDILMPYLERYVDINTLQKALKLSNRKEETARDIAELYDNTATIASLKVDGFLFERHMSVARANHWNILEVLNELSLRRT